MEKELSIEAKARRYDEAIERANELYDEHERDIALLIFPELRESENEKTKKEIINYLECQSRDEPTRKDTHNKWISYIKKHALSKDDYDFLRDCARVLKIFGYQSYADRLTGLCPALGEEAKAMMATPIIFDESKDDRIRKALLEMVHDTTGDELWVDYNVHKEDAIAWLERQDKNKMGISEATKQKLENNLNKALEKETPDSWNEFLEKQCKQKPVDKVEQEPAYKVKPKFKVGDIIRHKKHGFTCRIIAIDTEYRLSECCGTHLPFDWQDAYELVGQKPADKIEPKQEPKFKTGTYVVYLNNTYMLEDDGKHYILTAVKKNTSTPVVHIPYGDEDYTIRKWNIADAKDGDVLSWDDSKCIALFKNIYDKDSFNSYGFVGDCTGTFESRMSYHDIEGAHPATKEQRDQLEKAITEAGYEWDADKKELKKIEPKKEWSEEDVRADAFIEKAAEWIKNKAENYIVDTPLCCYFDYKRAVEQFINYMKGE